MKRALLALLAVLIVVPLAVFAWQFMQHPDRAHPARPVADEAAQLQRGAYLARAGDCMACHTARGGEPYAGGRAIATPFGEVVAPNITPDPKTGIGEWSADDFWRAMHNGRGRDGRFLYPVFPYTSYTRVSREDSDAIHAWLRTVPPVQQQNREHALRFPYNQRWLLAGWRALYFRPGLYEADAGKPAEWNRGAYLVGPGPLRGLPQQPQCAGGHQRPRRPGRRPDTDLHLVCAGAHARRRHRPGRLAGRRPRGIAQDRGVGEERGLWPDGRGGAAKPAVPAR